MRNVVVLGAVAAALAGCGSSATAQAHGPIVFGISGGNIAPYRVSIQPDGTVRVVGSRRPLRRQISATRVRQLTTEMRQAHLVSRSCSGALPDIASRYIRAGGRTVTVHGGCEASFHRVWADLSRAVWRPVA